MSVSNAFGVYGSRVGSRDDTHLEPSVGSTAPSNVRPRLADHPSITLRAATHRLDDIATAIQNTGLHELRTIRIVCTNTEIRLEGVVSSFYVKQVATEAIRPIVSGLRIVNHLQVPQR